MTEQPIAAHCREALEYLRQKAAKAQEIFHTHEPQNTGHDAGDEDPNAWSNS
jgi:hypothetical protein|tara:strand:- start:242 stop:397 length:156 start_codon:yes stop_codon:yes gene_type:complete